MRNRHPGICYRCGKNVPPGEGHFERIRSPKPGEPKWRVQHAGCSVLYRGTRQHYINQPNTQIPEANQQSYREWLKDEQRRKQDLKEERKEHHSCPISR